MDDSCASTHECPSVPPSGPSEKSAEPCAPCPCISQFSCIESTSSNFLLSPKKAVKKVDYNKAKAILKTHSSITGENLFDHLTEIIKRIIDERPTNVADYFEQFSRDVRENKFRVVPRLSIEPYFDPQFLKLCEGVMESLKPVPRTMEDAFVEDEGGEPSLITAFSESSFGKIPRILAPSENVLQLQHLFAFCGLGFQIDEIFQLSLAIQRVLYHRIVRSARFWGRMYGVNASYYIVEATLTKSETEIRCETLKTNLLGKMIAYINRRDDVGPPLTINPNLIPGLTWQDYPTEDIERMKPDALPVPVLKIPEKFSPQPEPPGIGLNRKVYFVTTSLAGEWYELPIVTPKQIEVSRKIKKYFTGNLEARISSYPLFSGLEKHYLRAMIARITAGTYVAPEGFYRRMTRKEIEDMDRVIEPIDEDEENQQLEEEEGEPEDEGEEEVYDNDAMLIENSDYEPLRLSDLMRPSAWVHVRPNILNQGRVLYVDEELALRDLEKLAELKIKGPEVYDEEGEGEGFEEDYGQGEDEEEEILPEEEERPPPEIGPDLFTPCSEDNNEEFVKPWTIRYSSTYNKINRMVLMHSNLWPGAYSFTFENFCDSIYVGWGAKYVSRCISLEHAPEIQDYDCPDVNFEATDPTPEMEEKWRLYHLKKELMAAEEMVLSNVSVEYDVDDKEDDQY